MAPFCPDVNSSLVYALQKILPPVDSYITYTADIGAHEIFGVNFGNQLIENQTFCRYAILYHCYKSLVSDFLTDISLLESIQTNIVHWRK